MSNTLHFFVYILALTICIHRVHSVIDYIEAKYPLRVNPTFGFVIHIEIVNYLILG